MNLKRIIKEGISDSLDWIQDTQPGKKDIIDFNKKRYETTRDYDDIEIGDRFMPPGSHIIWTVDDMYEWGVSSRDYRFMVWLKNDKGSIRRKVYNRGNKFPGDYRPWRKIVDNDGGVPRVFWFEESGIHVRDEDEVALMCHKDVNNGTTSEPKDKCTDIFHKTAIRYIKKGTLQHQPQLSDIKDD